MKRKITYSQGILEGFEYLLTNHKEVFVFGQGLWSPWYVGATMTDLDIKFGRERIIDSPVSENAVTGAAVGAAIAGYRPIVVHPRLDFMILAMDSIVNQAAKWRHMFGGQINVPITIRGIINRGGEQGAQHSQALHSWYAHIPGLRVVLPATPSDARDLLIASVLCNDPVMFVDDKWAYDFEEEVDDVIIEKVLALETSKILKKGSDITLVGAGYSTQLCLKAVEMLGGKASIEVIDVRILNPNDYNVIKDSVKKTGNLVVVDGGWTNCGLAGEIIASVCESLEVGVLKSKPIRLTLTNAPAPTSKPLEAIYYTQPSHICDAISKTLNL